MPRVRRRLFRSLVRPLPAGCRLTCIWFEVVWVLTFDSYCILLYLIDFFGDWEDGPKMVLPFGTAVDFLSRSLFLVDVLLQCDELVVSINGYPKIVGL